MLLPGALVCHSCLPEHSEAPGGRVGGVAVRGVRHRLLLTQKDPESLQSVLWEMEGSMTWLLGTFSAVVRKQPVG